MQRLTEPEMERLLAIAKAEDLQDYIIFGLAFEGFMRVSEVLELRAGDILPDGRVVCHRLKGSTTNVLPIRNEDVLVAVNWLLTHRPRKGDLLFNRARRTLDWRMKQYGAKVGIPAEKCHMHAIKHGACQQALDETGGSVMAVKTLAGHASISSTMAYVGMTTEQALDLRNTVTPCNTNQPEVSLHGVTKPQEPVVTPCNNPEPEKTLAQTWGAAAGGE
jgi:integrase